jgi:hypothetical protein
LAALPCPTRDLFCSDLSTVQATVRAGVVPTRAAASDRHWENWATFCLEHTFDPYLRGIRDPVPILQVWATRYRDGRLAPGGKPVRSGTVEDALRSVGQAFARLGAHDIRKDATGALDFRLHHQLRAWRNEDPAPSRVKPIPLSVIQHILNLAHSVHGSPVSQAFADMITLAFFFFLLRPGEYTGTTGRTKPLRLKSVQLFVGPQRLHLLTASVPNLIYI